jgi:deoxyribonuclease-1-like protein
MLRLLLVALLVALIGGGVFFFWNYQIERHYEDGKFAYLKITPRTRGDQPGDRPPARSPQGTIRIATFNLGQLDERKLNNRAVSDTLVKVLPRYELIALQGLLGPSRGAIVRLVEQINKTTGRHYDFAAIPPGRDPNDEYSAFLFDQTALEIDRSTLHAVDTAGRIRRPPLVAAFRVRGLPEAEAFTFTAINVHTSPDRVSAEIDVLADVFRAVRDDKLRDEDDVILLGDLEADENHLGQLGQVPGLTAAVTGTPTTLRGTRRADNILFDRRATVEFTSSSGVLDLMRELDLSLEAAREISEHLPVWAEFSSYEGGQPGAMAGSGAAGR